MKKQLPTLIAVLVWSVLNNQQAIADLRQQCAIGIPSYNKPIVSGDVNDLPVDIQADHFEAKYPQLGVYQGDVNIIQGNRTIKADRAEVNQTPIEGKQEPLRTVTLTGNVKYEDPQIQFQSPQVSSNIDTNDVDIEANQYQMVGKQGRGISALSQLRDERFAIMKDGTFTTCQPGDNSWSLSGSTIIHDKKEQVAEIWNARFNIGSVPVFYSPYLQFPTGDQRRSGFLIPNAKYDTKNGMEFILPYYWNIAPNLDATITAHAIGHRGLQLQNEFRYLFGFGSGTLAVDWLKDDRLYHKKMASGKEPYRHNDDRWLFYWNHNGVLNRYWRFNIDYTKVSDSSYFQDLSSAYGSSTDGYATQKYSTGYANDNWNATLSMKRFQIFAADQSDDVYRAEPQLELNNYQYDLGPFDLHTYAQITRLVSPNINNPKATRFHIEPTLSLPLANDWGSILTEAKLFATHYDQDIPKSYTQRKNLEEQVNRVLPQFKINAKVVFENDFPLLDGYTQTLEPQVQYQYVPFHNQDNINIYDSTLLQLDYRGLFRDRTYSGLDRIASANQLTTGVTSRVYDDALEERFNASIGQIYYFKEPKTGDSISSIDRKANTGSLTWAADSFWKINEQLVFKAGVQYDRRLGQVALAETTMEYRYDADKMLQTSYRYASKNYILSTITNPSDQYKQDISQAGAMGSWPLTDQLVAIGAYYYDTKLHQTAESYMGFQYNTCCWSVNVVYGRKIVGMMNNQSQYDNKVSFNFELRGFSNNYSSGARRLLVNSGILPYQPAF